MSTYVGVEVYLHIFLNPALYTGEVYYRISENNDRNVCILPFLRSDKCCPSDHCGPLQFFCSGWKKLSRRSSRHFPDRGKDSHLPIY